MDVSCSRSAIPSTVPRTGSSWVTRLRADGHQLRCCSSLGVGTSRSARSPASDRERFANRRPQFGHQLMWSRTRASVWASSSSSTYADRCARVSRHRSRRRLTGFRVPAIGLSRSWRSAKGARPGGCRISASARGRSAPYLTRARAKRIQRIVSMRLGSKVKEPMSERAAQATFTSVPIGVYFHTASAVFGGISTQPRLWG